MFYSYVDTALRVIHFNLDFFGEHTEEAQQFGQILSNLETARTVKIKFLRDQVDAFHQRQDANGLIVHEFHHYWQAIFYPFLYYISWLEYTTYLNLRSEILDSVDISLTFHTVFKNKIYNENITGSVFPFYLDFSADYFKVLDRLESGDEFSFTLIDLIEEATTIFQYKSTTGDPCAENFFAWIQNPRNKSYKKIHKYLMRYRDKAFIYNNFQACVQLAFHTTAPPEVFILLLNSAYRYHIDGSTAKGYSQLEAMLGQIPEMAPDAPLYTNYLRLNPYRITDNFLERLSQWADVERGHYPLSVHVKKFLGCKNGKENTGLRLLHPTSENIKYLMENFHPYAVHYNFTDIGGRNGSLHLSHEFQKIEVPGSAMSYDHLLMDFLATVGTIQSLFTDINRSVPHLCHHLDCSYHKTNLCQKFTTIPLNPVDCHFPDWLAIFFHLKIDPAKPDRLIITKLKAADVAEAQKRFDSRRERLNKKGKYQYKDLGEIITLPISKKIIKEMDPQFPREHFEYVKTELGLPVTEMFNRFTLDFPEYENDPRPIFEIPEIKQWIALLKKSVPEIFFYIAFDSGSNQQIAFLPFFAKYTNLSPEGEIKLKFEYTDIIDCIFNEAQSLVAFYTANHLDAETYTKKLYNNIFKPFENESKI